MINYDAEELQIIFSSLLGEFSKCKNDFETREQIYKKTKETLDLIIKLDKEERKKIKKRGWNIEKK